MHDTMENFARAPPRRERCVGFKARCAVGVTDAGRNLGVLGPGDPFSSLGAAAQTISVGQFATGLIELAIVVGGLLLAFSGRVLGGVLIAIIGGGMLALSAAKWEGWIQGL